MWSTIAHNEYNFSISYREDWNVDLYSEYGRKGDHATKLHLYSPNYSPFLFSSRPTAYIQIRIKAHPNPTLEDVVDWGNERIDTNQSMPGVQYTPGYQEFVYETEDRAIGLIVRRQYTAFYLDNSNLIVEELYLPRADDMVIIRLQAHKDILDEVYVIYEEVANSFLTIR